MKSLGMIYILSKIMKLIDYIYKLLVKNNKLAQYINMFIF